MTAQLLANVPVLVLVRDVVQRRTIARALEDAGAWVTEAERALQGMAFSQGGVELIIVDPDLPDSDGLELILQMKRHYRTAHVPLLLVSAAPIAAVDRVVGRDGADRYLTHPVDPAELVDIAVDLLRLADDERVERERAALGVDS